jgi:2-polyprenyl-3-methyl-5-hydroxy-6-metoxy-1,4-benzoquinol methylase
MVKKISEQIYNNQFYNGMAIGSYKSAIIIIGILKNFIDFVSVVDLGCGRGGWLKAFHESGAKTIVGVDGYWNHKNNMIDNFIQFIPCDLNQPLLIKDIGEFDIAVSLEVAEHLNLSSAKPFVQTLTNLSRVVLFSAAYPGQTGTNHINEQLPSWWAEIFQLLTLWHLT